MSKKYYFLDNDVYSPNHLTGVFGAEVEIAKRDGDEVWFKFANGDTGYVVYPQLFADVTPENKSLLNEYIEINHKISVLYDRQAKLFDNITTLK